MTGEAAALRWGGATPWRPPPDQVLLVFQDQTGFPDRGAEDRGQGAEGAGTEPEIEVKRVFVMTIKRQIHLVSTGFLVRFVQCLARIIRGIIRTSGSDLRSELKPY